jgi:hypothetical protein
METSPVVGRGAVMTKPLLISRRREVEKRIVDLNKVV